MSSKIEFKRIDQNPVELNNFAETAASYGGIRIPIEYNRASETWGLYVDGTLKGGFVLASGSTMRIPLIVPEEILSSSEYLAQFKRSDWCEVNQVWLSDDVKHYGISMRMWLHIRKCVLRSGHAIVLVPWQRKNKGIDRFYRTFVSHVVYEGVPRGRAGHALEMVVGIANMSDVKFTSMKHLPSYLMRIIMNRRRSPKLYANTGS